METLEPPQPNARALESSIPGSGGSCIVQVSGHSMQVPLLLRAIKPRVLLHPGARVEGPGVGRRVARSLFKGTAPSPSPSEPEAVLH